MRVQCLPHHEAPTFHVCHILGYSPRELDLHHSFNSIKKYDDYRSISTIFFVRDGIFRNEIESAFLLQVYEKPCRVYTEILRSLKNSKKIQKGSCVTMQMWKATVWLVEGTGTLPGDVIALSLQVYRPDVVPIHDGTCPVMYVLYRMYCTTQVRGF